MSDVSELSQHSLYGGSETTGRVGVVLYRVVETDQDNDHIPTRYMAQWDVYSVLGGLELEMLWYASKGDSVLLGSTMWFADDRRDRMRTVGLQREGGGRSTHLKATETATMRAKGKSIVGTC